MDKFTKRFYEKGNENNKKSGGSFPLYPIGYDKDSVPNAIKRGKLRRKNEAKQKALNKKKSTETRPLTGKGHDFYESIEHDFTK